MSTPLAPVNPNNPSVNPDLETTPPNDQGIHPLTSILSGSASSTSSSALPAIEANSHAALITNSSNSSSSSYPMPLTPHPSSQAQADDPLTPFIHGVDVTSPDRVERTISTMRNLQFIQPKPPSRPATPTGDILGTRSRSSSSGSQPKTPTAPNQYVQYKDESHQSTTGSVKFRPSSTSHSDGGIIQINPKSQTPTGRSTRSASTGTTGKIEFTSPSSSGGYVHVKRSQTPTGSSSSSRAGTLDNLSNFTPPNSAGYVQVGRSQTPTGRSTRFTSTGTTGKIEFTSPSSSGGYVHVKRSQTPTGSSTGSSSSADEGKNPFTFSSSKNLGQTTPAFERPPSLSPSGGTKTPYPSPVDSGSSSFQKTPTSNSSSLQSFSQVPRTPKKMNPQFRKPVPISLPTREGHSSVNAASSHSGTHSPATKSPRPNTAPPPSPSATSMLPSVEE